MPDAPITLEEACSAYHSANLANPWFGCAIAGHDGHGRPAVAVMVKTLWGQQHVPAHIDGFPTVVTYIGPPA